MGLPGAQNFGRNHFNEIEDVLGEHLRRVAEETMEDALKLEVKMSVSRNQYIAWLNNTLPSLPEVAASYDMGWQKRSSGRTYNSVSGHGMMIGCRSSKVIDAVVLSKRCNICSTPILEALSPHICPKNYEGSSKGMEAEGSLRLCVRARERKYAIGIIVSDDDSTMRAVLKHSHKAKEKDDNTYIWPRNDKGVKLPDKGRLPLNIPEPTFYADPSHRTKILAKKLFQLLSKGKSITSITKGDCLKSKKYFGYFLKQHRHQSKEVFALAAKAPLEHLFDNQEFCGPWCKRKDDTNDLVQHH